MESLPIYICIVFILTTLLTALWLYKATNYSKRVIIITLLWLIIQAVVSIAGFYTFTKGSPPRFSMLIIPPVIFIIMLFLTKKGKDFIDTLDLKTLTLLHIVRIPVEITLYWLFLHKTIPQIMTFEGRNFDILCGITAPLVYYFGYLKNLLSTRIILLWNFTCLLLLANIVITAVLSGPFAIQRFGFEQPNIALLYFPFVWLPCFVVPVVLLAHLTGIKRHLSGVNS